ncbi:MAG: hypothetical protein DCC75_13185, partial [Proteobacteria bacterium]
RIGQYADPSFAQFLIEEHKIPVSEFKSEERMVRAINGYDARIMYVDDQIKRLYERLNELGLSNNSLWVITSDHGEGLGNHNYFGHGEYLYQEQLHVPLILYSEAEMAGLKGRYSELVRTVDLFPTIAEMLGRPLEREKLGLDGLSLVPAISGGEFNPPQPHLALAQRRPKDFQTFRRKWEEGDVYAVLDLKEKLIEHSKSSDEFFDLEKDPKELNNLAEDEPKRTSRMQQQLHGILSSGKTFEPAPSEPISPDTLDELKTLGYM